MKRLSGLCFFATVFLLMLLMMVTAVSAGDGPVDEGVLRGSELADESVLMSLLGVGTEVTNDAPDAATLEVWYGPTQDFGTLGNPQRMINILGNVSGATYLHYQLNGSGTWEGLGMGGLGGSARLVSLGDFNAEIDTTNLVNGVNTVDLRADYSQLLGTVTVNYTTGTKWPLPYTIDWSQVEDITDVAQVVDGEWRLEGDGIRTVVPGYDRIVAIGDKTWDDYEVLVPVTIHDYAGPIGEVGVLARWQGHFRVEYEQPSLGWWEMGALAKYSNPTPEYGDPHFALRFSKGNVEPYYYRDESVRLYTGIPYWYKLRVQTKTPGESGFYSAKIWPVGNDEPSSWNIAKHDIEDGLRTGSVLLVAYLTDVSFGDVVIRPLVDIETSTEGSGSVDVAPGLVDVSDAYVWGDEVTLTANANPDWVFVGWSGSLEGAENPAAYTLTGTNTITATFVPDSGYTLDASAVPAEGGSVRADPDLETYNYGQVVELTAEANPGWRFDHWEGDLAGVESPKQLAINGNTTVEARFLEEEYTLTVNPIGEGRVDRDPDKPTYRYGDQVALTAVPGTGWDFENWSGDAQGSQNPVSITMDAAKTVSATFALLPNVNLSLGWVPVQAGANAVTVTPDQPKFFLGQPVTLTNTSDPGWALTSWTGPDGAEVTQSGDVTWTLVMDSDKSITAVFVQETYELLAGAEPAGSGSVARNPDLASYPYGQTVQLKAQPSPGWWFKEWSGDLSGTQNPASLTMDGNKKVTAVYVRNLIFLPLVSRSAP